MAARRLLVVALTLGGGGIATMLATKHPSNDRRWAIDQARLPEITISDSIARIANVRNFSYGDSARFTIDYEARSYDLRRLRSAWLVLAPFSKAWRGPAHTFVSFGFDDSTFVAISVEARREVDEEYGLFRGLGRNFELMYVIGEERDLIGKRAALGESDVYLYPLRAPPEKIAALFARMLDRAERLRGRPEFYNTLSNNCTSNLVAHVNAITPGRIPLGFKLLVPGYADEVAQTIGLLPPGAATAGFRDRYRIDAVARKYLMAKDFSLRIRDRLPVLQ